MTRRPGRAPARGRGTEKPCPPRRERGPEVLEGTDPDLRRGLEKLLAQESDGQILDRRLAELLSELTQSQIIPPRPAPDIVGRTIGHYEIRERLGAGGV